MKALLSCLLYLTATLQAGAHCQVPCGIFDDEVTFSQLRQHADTIRKAMNEIVAIDAKDDDTAHDEQQLVRWVMTKEDHAQKVQQAMLDYFLAQRLKADADNYATQLQTIHAIITTAMRCKQAVDTQQVDKLDALIDRYEIQYFGKAVKHDHEHHHHDDHDHDHDHQHDHDHDHHH